MADHGKSMKITNGRHKNDKPLDEMNKRVSKTENFKKLTEFFRKQWSAAKEIKHGLPKIYFIFISIFQI